MASMSSTMRKLIEALQAKGDKIVLSNKCFYGNDGKPHRLYSVSKATWDEDKNRFHHSEIYSSTSNIRMVLFLRDRLYLLEGKKLPTDNTIWNDLRKDIPVYGQCGQ